MINLFVKILFVGFLFFNTTSLFAGLLSDTIILTGLSDFKKVEDLKVGDGVLIYNIPRHDVDRELSPINKITKKKKKKLVLINTNTGYLKVGEDQKLYNREALKFIKAKEFKVGDKLFSPTVGELIVTDVYIHEVDNKVELYDISIDGANLFFILNSRGDPVLVHNVAVTLTFVAAFVAVVTEPAVVVGAAKLTAFGAGVLLGNYLSTGSTGFKQAAKGVGHTAQDSYGWFNQKVIRKTPLSRSHRRKKREKKRARRNGGSNTAKESEDAEGSKEGNDSSVSPEKSRNPDLVEVLEDAKRIDKQKGPSDVWEKEGGEEQKERDFDKINKGEVEYIISPKGIIKKGKTSSGETIIDRDFSSNISGDKPTLEIQHGKHDYTKIRY